MGKAFHVGHGNLDDEVSWSVPSFKEKVIEYIVPESTNGKLTREEALFENTRRYLKDVPPIHELPRGAAWEAPDVLDDAYADARVANHAIDRLRQLSEDPDQPFLWQWVSPGRIYPIVFLKNTGIFITQTIYRCLLMKRHPKVLPISQRSGIMKWRLTIPFLSERMFMMTI